MTKEMKDYETIDEPILNNNIEKDFVTIQQVTKRINRLKGNVIPHIQACIDYNNEVEKDTIALETLLQDYKQELRKLCWEREEIKNG